MKQKILIFLKGILMGICDLIPGISGGTIAFITGIYERLINAVKAFSPKLIFGSKKDIKKLDLGFLIILFLGIGTALFLGSGIIKYLLETYPGYTFAFFVGLILASSKIIFTHIKNHKLKNRLFALFGLLVGIFLAFIVPANTTPTCFYIFLGGFVAISAMFLPGILGAFILLIMGLYEFMINVLHDISGNIKYFIIFVLGAIFGAFSISRIISFLFKKDKCKTLYFLLGLVIGALSIPIKRILESISEGTLSIPFSLIYILLGIILVSVITRYSK